jgi:hypothetical protein
MQLEHISPWEPQAPLIGDLAAVMAHDCPNRVCWHRESLFTVMRRVLLEADLDHFASVSDRLSQVGSSCTRSAVVAVFANVDYFNTDWDANSPWRMEGQARLMPPITRP